MRRCVLLVAAMAAILMTTIGFVPAHASMDSALLVSESDYESIESALVGLLDAAGNKKIVVYDSSELSAEILEGFPCQDSNLNLLRISGSSSD